MASNGAHVWAVNTSNNSVTELKSGSGPLISVLKDKKFDFEGPERLSDDWTHVWVANDAGNSITELNANTGKLIAVIKGSSYKLHGTGFVTSNGVDVWISNLRGNELAEISASTGDFIQRHQDQIVGYRAGQQPDLGREARVGRR